MIHTGAMIQTFATEIPAAGASVSCVSLLWPAEPRPDFTEMKDAQQSAVKRELSVFVDLDHTMLVFNLLCCQISGISSWNNLITENLCIRWSSWTAVKFFQFDTGHRLEQMAEIVYKYYSARVWHWLVMRHSPNPQVSSFSSANLKKG